MSFLLLTQSFSKTLKSSVYNSRKSSKRGASEIIGVMILLGVTVSGALLVFTLLSTNDILDFATVHGIQLATAGSDRPPCSPGFPSEIHAETENRADPFG